MKRQWWVKVSAPAPRRSSIPTRVLALSRQVEKRLAGVVAQGARAAIAGALRHLGEEPFRCGLAKAIEERRHPKIHARRVAQPPGGSSGVPLHGVDALRRIRLGACT